MAAVGEDVVEAKVCKCQWCLKYRNEFSERIFDKSEFDFSSSTFDFKFPKIVNPNSDEPVDFFSIAQVLETSPTDVEEEHVLKVVRFLTYLDTSSTELPLNAYVMIAEYLFDHDLQILSINESLAVDFLQKTLQLFVVTWHALTVQENSKAEWAAREFRRILAYLLGFPVLASKVIPAIFADDNWPTVGPITILERICKDWLTCLDTVSLLVNLTRIENVCDRLEKDSQCLQIIKDKFSVCCAHIQSYDDVGELFMLLLMNLTASQEFLRFIIESNHGFFMNIVLADLIKHPDCCTAPRNVVWTFLRNLSLMEGGREMINKNLDLYLGHILYPIAGPEKLNVDEDVNIPLEVADLHENKRRVKDIKIRECIVDILYSLCRYKVDRISLRDAGVYEILKHYHLAERDPNLLDRIEDLVNILIRKEGSEIEVDDLMDGLTLGPLTTRALESSSEKTFLKPRRPSIKEAERTILRQILTTLAAKHKALPTKIEPRAIIEDDDNHQPFTNICTFEARSSSKKPFDYHLFELFYKHRACLFQVRRLQKRHEKSCRTASNHYIQPSDDFLKKKLTELYGPMNFDEPLMQKRLAAMKASIKDMSAWQPDELNIKLLELDVEGLNAQSQEEQLQTIIQERFPAELQQKFGKLDPSESVGEWFLLPRPAPREIRKRHFPMYGDDPEEAMELREREKFIASNPTPLTNLHLYDPRFEYCFDMPYRILVENPEDLIPRILSFRITEFLQNFPLGITPDMFWQKFIRHHGYSPAYQHFGIPSLLEVLRRHEEDMYVLESSYTLIFPPHLERVSHPDVILKRLWHLVKSVLSGADYCIPTDEIFKTIKDDYGVDFDPLDWAFASVNAFLNFIIQKFGYKQHMTIHRINYENAGDNAFIDYLTMCSEELSKAIENLHGVKSDIMRGREKDILLGRIPDGYLHPQSIMTSYSDNLAQNTNVLAELKSVHDPENLILFLRTDIVKLWRFHWSLQEPELTSKFDSQHPPDPRLLQLGLYVMVKTKWAHFGPFWFRVRILSIDPDMKKYYVYGIDFGFKEWVEGKDMRYMPRAEIGDEMAYAVPAKLKDVKNPGKDANYRWDMTIVNHVLNIYLEKGSVLRVNLVERDYNSELGCAEWTVSCDAINQSKVFIKFETLFMNHYMKEWKKMKRANEKAKSRSSKTLPPPIAND